MKIDMNKPLLDLDGKQLEKQTIGKAVAYALSHSTAGDGMKMFDWSMCLHRGEVLDLDTADQELLKKAINESQIIINLAKGQALKLLIKGGN